MQQFLNYGRQLTTEEIELLLLEDPSAPKCTPPTIEQFKEQVGKTSDLISVVTKLFTSNLQA